MMKRLVVGGNTNSSFGVVGHCNDTINKSNILLFDRVKIIIKENIIFCLISKILKQK
jgi:hypothetical protein